MTPLMTLKIALFAPMPSASVRIAEQRERRRPSQAPDRVAEILNIAHGRPIVGPLVGLE